MGKANITRQNGAGKVTVYTETDLSIVDHQNLQFPEGICYRDIDKMLILVRYDANYCACYYKRSDYSYTLAKTGSYAQSITISPTATEMSAAYDATIEYALIILK